jgi:hypothetical protein
MKFDSLTVVCGVVLFGAALGACAGEQDGGEGGTAPLGGTPTPGGAAPGGAPEGGGPEGGGGGVPGMCAQDCSTIDVPLCFQGVCNEETGVCEIVASGDGDSCEDGLYCTEGDTCQAGVCIAGGPKVCEGGGTDPCLVNNCNEGLKTCSVASAPNGTGCTSLDTCISNAICQNGVCLGAPLDCSGTPSPDECHAMACDPLSGNSCQPVIANDGAPCSSFGDPCMDGKTCSAGDCVGGSPKVCPSNGCNNGACEAGTGNCLLVPIPPGGVCTEATDACNTGICNNSGQCIGQPANDGASCTDGNSCTVNDICGAGSCAGTPDPMYTVYFNETFASNNQGWTLGPEWAIGSAQASTCAGAFSSAGDDPGTDHTSSADNGVAGVLLGQCYSATLHADYCITSPVIDASAPGGVALTYWRHLHTDYPNYISSHVDVSSNAGASWTTVFSVPQFGPFVNDLAWTQLSHDVTAQKSATMQVRFCYSAGPNSGIVTGGGWNVDDVVLASSACP